MIPIPRVNYVDERFRASSKKRTTTVDPRMWAQCSTFFCAIGPWQTSYRISTILQRPDVFVTYQSGPKRIPLLHLES